MLRVRLSWHSSLVLRVASSLTLLLICCPDSTKKTGGVTGRRELVCSSEPGQEVCYSHGSPKVAQVQIEIAFEVL